MSDTGRVRPARRSTMRPGRVGCGSSVTVFCPCLTPDVAVWVRARGRGRRTRRSRRPGRPSRRLLREEREHELVAARAAVGLRGQPPAQETLLREAELARGSARLRSFSGSTVRSRRGRARSARNRPASAPRPPPSRAPARSSRRDPVPDLERAVAAARVQAAAAERPRLVADRRSRTRILAEVELAAELACELQLLVERLRLEPRSTASTAADARGSSRPRPSAAARRPGPSSG